MFVQPRLGGSLEVGWLSGACLAVRREVLLAAGGFDERYFMYQEDMALGRRLAALGYRQIMRADVQVQHGGGASSDIAATWLWRQRSAALSAYIESGNGPVSAAAMRLTLSSGFRLRGIYHRSVGSRSRVAEMRTYAQVLRNAEPEPPRPQG
jgi:N-acetylglucosaminyl-diphospho-decaprenol L-rhamnosyltransferase